MGNLTFFFIGAGTMLGLTLLFFWAVSYIDKHTREERIEFRRDREF